MAALGDSLTRGWGTSGALADNPSQSWATGDDSSVDSHYLRLVRRFPAVAGHVENDAVSGSTMAATYDQASAAVAQGASYVTLFSGTNDVCTTTASQMTSVTDFSTQLTATLTKLTQGIPGVRVLVVSIPNWYALYQSFNSDPAALNAWATYYGGVCPTIFGAATSDADRAEAQQRIQDLNLAAASACALFPGCVSDGGAVYGMTFARTDLTFDYFHLSPAGQARLAAVTWQAGPFAQPPPLGSFAAAGGDATATLTWTVPDDVARVVVVRTTGSPAATPGDGSVVYDGSGSAGTASASGLTNGVTYAFAAWTYDVDGVLGPRVTASATPSAPASTLFDSFVVDGGCGGCSAGVVGDELRAVVEGGADSVDTAYGLKDFGGVGGWSGRVFARTVLRLGSGQVLSANVAVFQVLDVSQQIVFELYVAPDRSLRLWSAAGRLQGASINVSTGVVVPNDGSSVRVEVSALRNSSVVVRVNGVDRVSLSGLSGGSSGNVRWLLAGIDHYDSVSASDPVVVFHGSVGWSTVDWLGAPAGGSVAPPASTGLPVVSGSVVEGQALSVSSGVWSGSPTSFAYQWQRCDSAGAGCVAVVGATAATYTLVGADVGHALRAVVTATNAGGSTAATSAPTAAVTAATTPPASLAPDPGFESDPSSSYYTFGTATFSWASDAAHGGARSLKIVATAPDALTRWLSLTTAIAATAGRTYSASAWLRTSGVSQYAQIVINFWSASQAHLGTWASPTVTGTTTWTNVSTGATAPAGTAYVRVEFRLVGAGTLWTDDLVLTG